VEEDDISSVIGKGGGRITDVENRLGIDIDVRTHDENPNYGAGGGAGGASPNGDGGSGGGSGGGSKVGQMVQPEITSRHIVIPVDGNHGETVEVQAAGEYLFTATVSRGGEIQVSLEGARSRRNSSERSTGKIR